jgi:hypothetical protein
VIHLVGVPPAERAGILREYVRVAPSGRQHFPLPVGAPLAALFGKPGAAFSMQQQFVEGDYAYILWTAETADNVYEVGTDTFVVRDGKIVAQSFAGKITPKG